MEGDLTLGGVGSIGGGHWVPLLSPPRWQEHNREHLQTRSFGDGWSPKYRLSPRRLASEIPEESVRISFHPVELCLNITSLRKWACVPFPSPIKWSCPVTCSPFWLFLSDLTLYRVPTGLSAPWGQDWHSTWHAVGTQRVCLWNYENMIWPQLIGTPGMTSG